MKKVLIMGLPGSGKTTLAGKLAALLPNAVHLNADEIRREVHQDLGFDHADRIEHARRLGYWAGLLARSGVYAIADFVCPTPWTRHAFAADITVWMNTIQAGRFPDTNRLFVAPPDANIRVDGFAYDVRAIVARITSWDAKAPTALLIGRYQPFHEGHLALVDEALRRVGQVYIAVRETGGTDSKNPFEFADVRARILSKLGERAGVMVGRVPNLTNVYYGRDVGYSIEQIELAPELQAVSATKLRAAG